MMNIPTELKYRKTDEWIRLEDGAATVGISDFAQGQLSDIVYVELLVHPGEAIAAGAPIATIESVKAASEVYAPAGGSVSAINEALPAQPELLNKEPYGGAWLIKMKSVAGADLDSLMDAKTYETFCAGRSH
jgi:glycine cleavage system H protein